ncbi:MAG TPA: GNAT family N-acetyltransferase [Actinomycetota bacterium]|nr:GNAT family N-acetyltransferase [Actinomycetota bacterium]
MSIQVRVGKKDEWRRFFDTCENAFGEEPNDDMVERFKRILSPSDLLAAFDGDAMVGTAAAFRFTLSIPGGELPAAGVTLVGVLPSHRRQGVLTRLMRHQLEQARARRQPLAVLWASEGSIYGRFGYGPATKQAAIDVERDRAVFIDQSPNPGRSRLLSTAEAVKVLPDVYERVRIRTPGMFARSQEWWEAHTLADPEEGRRGDGPMWRVVWENEGRAEAYALYRLHHEWPEGMPAGSLHVAEAIATSPAATRALWSFLFGVDLVARVRSWVVPIDHPLFLMLTEPRRLRMVVKDALWLRVVDVPAALGARGYAGEGTLVLALRDELCPWNSGTWRLETSASGARVERTTDAPQLAMSAADLGAVYLGGVGFGELVEAGRVHELEEGAALRASALFAAERTPWCSEIF